MDAAIAWVAEHLHLVCAPTQRRMHGRSQKPQKRLVITIPQAEPVVAEYPTIVPVLIGEPMLHYVACRRGKAAVRRWKRVHVVHTPEERHFV